MGPVGPEPVVVMTHASGAVINLILNAAPEAQTNVLMDVPVKHPGYTHMALAVKDVAAYIGDQPPAVSMRITRALRRLRELLGNAPR